MAIAISKQDVIALMAAIIYAGKKTWIGNASDVVHEASVIYSYVEAKMEEESD